MLNIRKLAAIDLAFLGPKIILVEFALGVIGPEFLGFLTLRSAIQHGHSARLTWFGIYLLALGINYVPLLGHAISLVRTGGARREIAAELQDKPAAMRKYRRQSLLLLLPLVVPIVALGQQWQRERGQP